MPLPPAAYAALPADVPGGRRAVQRIIAAEFDAVAFFEDLTPGADVDALLAVLSLTSPALLDLIGAPSRIPVVDRARGPGAGWVMPTFTRPGRPSRFSDGQFGIWYVAWDLETAIAETVYHNSRRLLETLEPAQDVRLQVLTADVAGFAAPLGGLAAPLGLAIHDPTSYGDSQPVGRYLRDRGSDAILYQSVRRAGGTCTGILRPRTVRGCRRTGLITYAWDGTTLTPGPLRSP